MPILKRDKNAPAVQSTAPDYVPDKDAVLEAFPNPRRAAMILYDENTPVKKIPLDDIALLTRMPDNATNQDVVYRNRIKSRMTAIRAFCVLCVGGPRAARMCPSVSCPLWPFRMGHNPFRGSK